MKSNEINKFRRDVARMVSDGRMHDAFAAMRAFSEGALSWEITTRIDRLEENYRAMLKYFAGGVNDPGRADVLASIAGETRELADSQARLSLLPVETSLYFGTARTVASRPGQTPRAAVDALTAELRRLQTDIITVADPARTREAEALAVDMFNRLWVCHPLTTDDLAAVTSFVCDTDLPVGPRALAVSAVGAGAMEFYDSRRAEFLLSIYMAPVEPEIALRALVGTFMLMFRYRRRQMSRRLADMLAAAKDFPTWQSDFRNAAIELMRTRDTARISDRLTKDILPTLSKLAPEIKEQMSGGSIDLDDLAEGVNPDWEELLNRDGLGEKLREMSEIQADGGDVYMSSFSSLKHFPFFRDMANWFLPFTPDHSQVASIDGGAVGTTLAKMPFLCDSDKYSVMLAVASAPSNLRDGALNAMTAQNGQMHEMLSEIEKASAATERKNIISNYVRDLYRFFNLFRRKGEFFNPFARGVDLMAIESLCEGFDDAETLTVIAEFNFRHKFYEEAAALFLKLDRLGDLDALRSQKIGFCFEKLGRYPQAISYYEQARMLGGDSDWLIEHLGRAFRGAGEPRRALEMFRRLEVSRPDDYSLAVTIGNTCLAAHMPESAEKMFHKAVYLDPDRTNGRRGLAWAQFVCRKFDDASRSYETLIGGEPTVEDYLNAGHVARAMGNMREAVNYYSLGMTKGGADIDTLAGWLEADAHWLADAGVDTSDTRLIIEAILYSVK